MFFSPEINRLLEPEYYTLKKKVRKQIADTPLAQVAESVASSTEISLLVIMGGTFLLNLLLSGGMVYFLALIRSLQMVLHIPMLKVIMPGISSMFFS